MKKLFLLVLVYTPVLFAHSFKPKEVPPRIYPELEKYFESLEKKEPAKDHVNALASLKGDISSSSMDYEDWHLIFYCSENTFRSQASQVFATTLCYANKFRKMKIHSAGLISGEVSTKLIDYLTRIGYKITESQNDDKVSYSVRFSDQANPIILYSKATTDKSLPTRYVTSVIVCDINTETDCAALKTESNPLNLAFPKVVATDSQQQAEAILEKIATEMVYVTRKKQ